MVLRIFFVLAAMFPASLLAQSSAQTLGDWRMQDVAKVFGDGALISSPAFRPEGWYTAMVPGTVLTTLVNDGAYPEPLYGENMRAIPESLNKTSYWYRTSFKVPARRISRSLSMAYESWFAAATGVSTKR
jgi:mannosylglycoprotein endo-beta-mannosidase